MTLVSDIETTAAPVEAAGVEPAAPAARWSLATRLAFRFAVIYFSLYVLLTQMFGALFGPLLSLLPEGAIKVPGSAWTVQTAVSWVATKAIGFGEPLQVTPTGSGDKPYDLALIVTLAVTAVIATFAWSLLARRRMAHPATHRWFRLFLRFALGTTMLGYGMVKFIPLQMPFPFLTRLLTPYGNFSLMGVLWSKIGASPAYETFTGAVEVTCALLLFIPGLTTLGALLSFITASQIFALNMMYDVPVKFFSFHLILISLVLLAPDAKRLFRVMVLRRGVGDAPEPPLVKRAGLRRALAALQIVFAAWLVISSYQSAKESYVSFGAGAPKPALYGIWDIERMEIDGVERAPLVTDYDRWRRLVVQNQFSVSFQRMNDTFQGFQATIDAEAKTITFKRGAGPQALEIGRLAYEQPAEDRLIAHGTLNDTPLRLEARRVDLAQMQMFNNTFRWIQERPFNR